jgi:hypothetical protein
MNLSGQLILSSDQEKKMLQYYNSGTRELEGGNYAKADSLLSLSIKIQSNIDNHFNRGLAKLAMRDTCHFCNDMFAASKLLDEKAELLFNQLCQKTDTSYLDENFNPANKSNYKYYEVQHISKFLGDTTVEVHILNGKNHYSLLSADILSGKSRPLDMIAMYEIKNNEKRYFFLEHQPQFDIIEDDIFRYLRYNINIPEDVKKNIFLDFIVNPEGKIQILQLLPQDLDDTYKQEITKVLFSLYDIKPAKFMSKKVIYEYWNKL